MGRIQRTIASQASASSAGACRWSPQACMRKGCVNVFVPGRWNQRYCQDDGCHRELRRWQSARRQQRRRQRPEVRREHAERERTRRRARRAVARASPAGATEAASSATSTRSNESAGAWSRGKKNPAPFCGRPGCYEPLPHGGRPPFRYCGGQCGGVMRGARERERKRLRRRGLRSARPRRAKPSAGACVVGSPRASRASEAGSATAGGANFGVRYSRPAAGRDLSSRSAPDVRAAETVTPRPVEEVRHDRETPAHPRPRAPPAS